MKVYRPAQQSHLFLIRHNIRFLNKGLRATWLIGLRCLVDPGLNISSRVQVATMVIALPLPTLQTRATEPLSSTRRGITPMGITRGYEQASTLLCLFTCCGLKLSLKCLSFSAGWLPTEL